jgi:hypothetical protein
MKKIFNSNSLTILLLIVAASCIARSIKDQSNSNDRFRYLSKKYSTINVNDTIGGWCILLLYSTRTSGTILTYAGLVPVASTDFDTDIHVSNDDACRLNHFSGNITAKPDPGTVAVVSGVISIDLYFCERVFNFNGTFCNGGYCQNYLTNGTYQTAQLNSTVTILGFLYEFLNY